MEFKKTSLILSTFLIALLAITFASASLDLTLNPTSVSLNPSNTTTFIATVANSFTDTNLSNINLTGLTLSSGSNTISLTANATNFNLANGTSRQVLLTSSSTSTLGTYTGTITVNGVNESNPSQSFSKNSTLTLTVNSLPVAPYNACKTVNNSADLIVNIDEVNVDEGFGDEDDYWYPFDKVSIDVNVENNGVYDLKDIEMKFCLRDKDVNSTKCLIDEDSVDFTSDKFDLKDGKDKDVTLTFTVDSEVLDEDIDNYEFYVSATGEINSDDSNDGKDSCDFESQDIDVRTGEEFVILSGLDEEYTASCGSSVSISGNAWNIDTSDVEGVTVEVYNKELGIDQSILVGDIDSFDFSEFSTSFNVPQNAVSKTYSIRLSVYNEDDDLFENDEGDESVFNVPLTISGNCQSTNTTASISATLESAAEVGQNMVVQVSITNTGATADFVITPSNYDSWASLVSVEPQSLNIPQGTTKQVQLTLKPNKAGTQSFAVEARTTTGKVLNQQVQVTVAEKAGFGSMFSSLGNTATFLIAAIVIVLILIIIVAIIKFSSRKKAEF